MKTCDFYWETQLGADSPYDFVTEDFDEEDFVSDYEWTDVSSDVRGTPEPTWSRGMSGGGPDDRVARVGVLSFSMFNHPRTVPQKLGYYTPGHSNARDGWGIGHGFRLRVVYQELNQVLFMGTIETIAPHAEGFRQVDVTVVDWMEEAATSQVEGLSTLIDVRSDEVIEALLDAMPRPPLDTSILEGQDTYAYALDGARAEGGSVLSEIYKVTASELGYAYLTADGTFVYEGRSARASTAVSNSYTFETELSGLSVKRSRSDLINKVKVSVHPRRLDADLVDLYEMSQPVELAAGQVTTMRVSFSDPNQRTRRTGAINVQPLIADTDYVGNTAENGLGAPATHYVSITADADGNGADVTVQNIGGIPIWLTELRIRGQGLYDAGPVISSAEDEDSVTRFGRRTRVLDMPYQPDPLIGASAANYLLSVYNDEMTFVESLTFLANLSDAVMRQALTGEIGDRVGVRESVTAVTDTVSGSITRGWYINGIRGEIAGGKWLRTTYVLAPTDHNTYWILGTAGATELGVTTRLGYGLFN